MWRARSTTEATKENGTRDEKGGSSAMSKGQRKNKGNKQGSNAVVCETFVDGELGHLVLFVLDHGKPAIYRQFWCPRRYRNDKGRFVAKGFRRHADEIMEIIEHPDEELAISHRNCDAETYTKLSVGCIRKNPGVILKAMQEDRDAIMEEYGLSEEDLARDGKRRVRRRSFVEWLFETETEEEHYKRIAEKQERRKAKREAKKAAREAKKEDKKAERAGNADKKEEDSSDTDSAKE